MNVLADARPFKPTSVGAADPDVLYPIGETLTGFLLGLPLENAAGRGSTAEAVDC